MLPTLPKILIIFLTILQLFAPLVHAHASESPSKQGLHVPGLEHYSSYHESTAYIKALAVHACIDGVMVSVGLGFQQKLITTKADMDNGFYLPMHRLPVSIVALPLKCYGSKPAQSLLARLLSSPPPSRAPPRV